MKYLTLLFLVTFPIFNISAHQPALNNENTSSPSNAYLIEKPEVSKAIYGTLKGDEHYYTIKSDINFNFYVGITTPKIDGCDTFNKFSVSVTKVSKGVEENLLVLDGENYEWWEWYEPYGKKFYWIGPEYGAEFKSTNIYKAGDYLIKVFNNNNQGKYVLATGDIEKFGPLVIAKLPLIMPKVNKFWELENCPN
mgnify:CR=1 FL=1|jgi:hypothetical protein|tara:strand:+ start:810 stop:1391 length:582 start_codon:yes stop_codon:yes gene_type:complete